MAAIKKKLEEYKKEAQSGPKEEKLVECPDCGCKEILYEKGERFCKKCGLVLES